MARFVPSASVVRSLAVARSGSSAALRPSVRSVSGWVCVALFPSAAGAVAFGAFFSRVLPVSCGGVRLRRAFRGFWSVSVPVVVSAVVR